MRPTKSCTAYGRALIAKGRLTCTMYDCYRELHFFRAEQLSASYQTNEPPCSWGASALWISGPQASASQGWWWRLSRCVRNTSLLPVFRCLAAEFCSAHGKGCTGRIVPGTVVYLISSSHVLVNSGYIDYNMLFHARWELLVRGYTKRAKWLLVWRGSTCGGLRKEAAVVGALLVSWSSNAGVCSLLVT